MFASVDFSLFSKNCWGEWLPASNQQTVADLRVSFEHGNFLDLNLATFCEKLKDLIDGDGTYLREWKIKYGLQSTVTQMKPSDERCF